MPVEEDLEFYLDNPDKKYAETNSHLCAIATLGDLCFARSWILHNARQKVNSTTLWQRHIDSAVEWELTTGHSSVLIAVID